MCPTEMFGGIKLKQQNGNPPVKRAKSLCATASRSLNVYKLDFPKYFGCCIKCNYMNYV